MKSVQHLSRRQSLFIASLLALLPLSAMATEGTPSMYAGMSGVFVPFVDSKANEDLLNSLRLNIGFNEGKPRHFTVDTGSTGILASPDNFTPGPNARIVGNAGEGELTYSSSGRINHGTWYQTTVHIYDDKGKEMAVAHVPVLQVTSITCLQTARDCQATNEPKGVAMMGVGFAREHDHQTQSTPDKNPFLELTSVATDKGPQPTSVAADKEQHIRHGYIFTNTGVYLGLTPSNTRDFAFIKLTPDAQGECSGATATIEVNGNAASGGLLMDTGVTSMFISPPSGTTLAAKEPVPPATQVSIYMPEKMPKGTPQPAFYTFTVGATKNALRPEKVTVVKDPAPFVNTGRYFLRGFQYLYDADGCYVGFKWTNHVQAKYGGVVPSK